MLKIKILTIKLCKAQAVVEVMVPINAVYILMVLEPFIYITCHNVSLMQTLLSGLHPKLLLMIFQVH